MSDTERDLDDIAARALATIILEHTAVLKHAEGNGSAEVLEQLEAATGLTLDVSAAILMATAALAGIGELTGEAINAAAMALDPSKDET